MKRTGSDSSFIPHPSSFSKEKTHVAKDENERSPGFDSAAGDD
jgi:hypothetical protein